MLNPTRSSLAFQILAVIPLTLAVVSPAWSQPVISPGGVVNAADYSASIAPGSMVAIFGSNLAGGLFVAPQVPLPSELAGVRVDVLDGDRTRPAAISFVSAGQINAQLPFNLQNSIVHLRVFRGGIPSAPVAVAISACGPGLYTWTGTGLGEVAAVHAADWALVNENNPAVPGEYLILYATGLGPVTDAPVVTGQPGGDNQQWGPVNYATSEVSVTIGGKPAAVVFAGLAPSFVGLYQVNIQLPTGLRSGKHPIVVQAGGAVSKGAAELSVRTTGGGGSAPADVVRRAMEAQVRGDVDGFLAECVTDGYNAEATQAARELLDLVRSHATFSNFEFTPLATGMGDLGTMAVVRAYVSFTVHAHDGPHEVTNGALSFLQKVNGDWKILHIVPDDLLNQQLYEESAANSAAANSVSRRYAGSAVNLEEFNQALNELLNSASVDEFKLGRSVAFGVIGTVPGVGDTLANINQVVEVVENTGGGLYEIYQNGFTGIGLLKFKQVGVGVLQIVCEPIPGLDAQADMVQASLEQLSHNLELARSIGEIQQHIRQLNAGETQVSPYLYPYPAYLFKYPAGVEMEPMEPAPHHSYGAPLGAISITAPTALDRRIPLMIAGELPIHGSNPAAAVAQQLGGQLRNGVVYMPVEIGYLAESDASDGDIILDDYNRYRTEDSVSRVVSWTVTCRRGRQDLKVRLRNGQVTPAVIVANNFMNLIDELAVQPLHDGKIEVDEGEEITDLRVVGRSVQLEPRFWPDLTDRDKCLDMAILDEDIASLERGQTLTIRGVGAGETSLELLLAGGSDGSVGELTGSAPVIVSGVAGPLFQESWTQKFYNGWWKADLSLTISSSNDDLRLTTDVTAGSLRQMLFEGSSPGRYMVNIGLSGVAPVEDDPGVFKILGQFGSGAKYEGSNFSSMIELPTESGSTIGRLTFSITVLRKTITGDWAREAESAVIYLIIEDRN